MYKTPVKKVVVKDTARISDVFRFSSVEEVELNAPLSAIGLAAF